MTTWCKLYTILQYLLSFTFSLIFTFALHEKKSLHLLLGSHDMRAYCINTQKHSRSGEAWPDMQGRGLAYYYSHNSLKIDDLLFKQ
jgi:hypothetical protein